MPTAKVHKGDIGTVFQCTFKDQDGSVVDLSGYTSVQIIFLKPDHTAETKDMTVTDAANGVANYTTVSGDIDQAGYWEYQGKAVIPSGTWYSLQKKFPVEDVFA